MKGVPYYSAMNEGRPGSVRDSGMNWEIVFNGIRAQDECGMGDGRCSGLDCVPPLYNLYVEVLTSKISECDLTRG